MASKATGRYWAIFRVRSGHGDKLSRYWPLVAVIRLGCWDLTYVASRATGRYWAIFAVRSGHGDKLSRYWPLVAVTAWLLYVTQV